MVQAGQYTGFAVELLLCLTQHVLIGAKVRLDFLNSTETAFEADIFCPVDSAHPTLSHRGDDAVTLAQKCPRLQQFRHVGCPLGNFRPPRAGRARRL